MTKRLGMALVLIAWLPLGQVRTAETKKAEPAKKGAVTTHVLNTASGKPASGMLVKLERQGEKDWQELGQGRTGDDGRANELYPASKKLEAGVYRLVFDTGAYFKAQGQKTFFPRAEIIFQIEKTDEHYHVPLLLSPFGYSTYRGS